METYSGESVLDVWQAAEVLKLSPSTVYKMTSQRRIPHFKRCKKLYFFRSELISWLQESCVLTTDQVKAEAASRL